MLDKVHKEYHEGKLSFRDYLSAHRTILANDRTWLGNIRTSLTFFVAGVSFIQFFGSSIVQVIGWIFVPLGIINLLIGLWQYRKRKNMFQLIEESDEIVKEYFDNQK
ncbi:DUF202 domain-containing protein [Patescibacteria group bacterium]|nr:DUF202 domain-containing protein [Patescibacteria group bacterium]MBU1683394.1 DUF202 domain-containing protein [Patescibacteria group bacterium]MBU1934833.1 DUF202 domain-containing protein [Patescibacteria group bacterium]